MTENHMQGVFARGLPHSRLSVGSNGALEHGGYQADHPWRSRQRTGRGKLVGPPPSSRFDLSILFCFIPKPGPCHCRIFFHPMEALKNA
jgi:hypothetical protein